MARRIEIWPIERLIPYARNPRTHSDQQVMQIAASIAEFGFVNPVLVATDDGIIAGHGRMLGAQELKLKEVPVIVLDHLTPAQRRAYLLADNKLAELAGWDEDLLRAELRELELADFDPAEDAAPEALAVGGDCRCTPRSLRLDRDHHLSRRSGVNRRWKRNAVHRDRDGIRCRGHARELLRHREIHLEFANSHQTGEIRREGDRPDGHGDAADALRRDEHAGGRSRQAGRKQLDRVTGRGVAERGADGWVSNVLTVREHAAGVVDSVHDNREDAG